MTSFSLGAVRCSYLNVGSFTINAETLFATAPATELARALARHNLDPEQIVFRVRSLFVDTGANRAIIDPAGVWEDKHRLASALEQASIDPASIDTVIISHGHADHFWGCVSADRNPLFPNARYWIQTREWRHWLAPDNPEPDHAHNFREALLPIEGVFSFADGEQEIVPRIRCQPTPGHSPGHMVVQIAGKAVYTGDVLLSPLNVERPEWTAAFDVWPEKVSAARRKLLDELSRAGSLVLTCHFPGSGAGRIVLEGESFLWQPVQLGLDER